MEFYEMMAQGIYAFIDFIAIEIISVSIFTIDDNNRIKFTFGRMIGDTRFKPSSMFIYVSLVIILLYFFASNYLQDTIISYLATTGWKTIPSFAAAASFSILWLTKVILGRKWSFGIVRTSLIVLLVSLVIIAFL